MTILAEGVTRRGFVAWTLAAAALAIATITLPPLAAEWSSSGRITITGIVETVSEGFTRWVASGAATPNAPLADAVTFWGVFHVTKAVLAIALLGTLVVVGYRMWTRATLAETRTTRAAWITVGVLGAWLPVLALLIVLANIQGAVAPLSSVMSFLPISATPGVEQVRAELATGAYGPVTGALVADFRNYHAALAVCLAVTIAGMGTAIVWMLVRRAQTPREARLPRRILGSGATALALLTTALGLILLANLSTVAETAPALAGFFG